MFEKLGKGVLDSISKYTGIIQQKTGDMLPAIKLDQSKSADDNMKGIMDWAKKRQAESEQLAYDSARLLASVTERMDVLKQQSFFRRCWNIFNGNARSMEQANFNDIINMQRIGAKYLNNLQEQNMLTAYSLLSLKNNLFAIAEQEAETREMVAENREMIAENREMIGEAFNQIGNAFNQIENTRIWLRETQQMVIELANRAQARFERLEQDVDQLKHSTSLHAWLLGLKERGYSKRFPGKITRLIRVVNDFYIQKKDQSVYEDILLLKSALRAVDINPDEDLSLDDLVSTLIDELLAYDEQYKVFPEELLRHAPKNIRNYSSYALKQAPLPYFAALHALNLNYTDRNTVICELQDDMNISGKEALKRLITKDIDKLYVNRNYKFSIGDIAVDILNGIRLVENLAAAQKKRTKIEHKKPVPIHEKPKEKILRNTAALDLAIDVLTHLADRTTRLGETRYYLQNKIKGYHYLKNPDLNCNPKIPQIFYEIGTRLDYPIYDDDIRYYAYDDSKFYLCTYEDDIIMVYDANKNQYGIIRDRDLIDIRQGKFNAKIYEIERLERLVERKLDKEYEINENKRIDSIGSAISVSGKESIHILGNACKNIIHNMMKKKK